MDQSIATFEASVGLLISNKFAESRELLTAALASCEDPCDPGIKALLRIGVASVTLGEALTGGAVDQAAKSLSLLEQADAEAGESQEFFINTLVRACALLFSSFCLFLQQRWTAGAFGILKSWRLVSLHLEQWLSHDRKFVRSLARFIVGTLNLSISILPPTYVSIAEFAGFDGSRCKAVEHLRLCVAEDGALAPVAMLVLGGFFAGMKPFMFEHMTPQETSEVQRFLSVAAERFPGSCFFALSACSFHLATRDAKKAVQAIGDAAASQELPALNVLMLYRKALAFASVLDFDNMRDVLKEALRVLQTTGRCSHLPHIAFLYFLASGAAGKEENADEDAMALIDLHRADQDKTEVWLPADVWAFRRSKAFTDGERRRTANEYAVELLFGVYIFGFLVDKMPLRLLDKKADVNLFKTLELDEDAAWDTRCKRNIILAEVYRAHNRLGEALGVLDEILDNEATAEVGASDAIVPLALLLQAIVFVQAGEVDAAKESVNDLETALAASTSNFFARLSKHTVTTGTEFDTFVFFKRHALERRIEAGGFESADSSEPE